MNLTTLRNKIQLAATTAILLAASNEAFAGLGAITTEITTIRTAIYAAAGVGSGLYLLWLGIMAKVEKKSWGDFGMGVVHVALLGASIVLAAWAWSIWGS